MVKKVLLKSLFKSVGAYQLVLLSSRGLGFFRDFLILLVLGASALSDDVFFLIGFADLVTTIVAGGGAVLYLSLQMNTEPSENYYSGLIFYIVIGLCFVAFEILSSSFVGSFLYKPLAHASQTNEAYRITLLGIVFTFPLVCSYAVFLNINKIYLQPSINLVFTLFVIFVLLFFYISSSFDLVLFANLLFVAVAIRFVFAIALSKKFISLRVAHFRLRRSWKFYFDMLISGLSVGILISVPFVFRGHLPEFGSGIYSTSAFVFKLNDMVLALLFIPLISLLLNRFELTTKLIVKLASLSIFVPLFLIAIYYAFTSIYSETDSLLKEYGFSEEVVRFSFYAFLFTCSAYLFSMVLVKLKQQKILFLSSVLLISGVRANYFYSEDTSLAAYFYNLYLCYSVFILCMIASVVFFIKKLGRSTA